MSRRRESEFAIEPVPGRGLSSVEAHQLLLSACPGVAEWICWELKANYRMSANQITEEVEPDALVALMGKPDRTATLGRMTYWFYNCRDGQIMMQFESETFAVFGRIIAAEINDY